MKTTTATTSIGLTPYNFNDGEIRYAGIRVNAEGDYMARVPSGELKRYGKLASAVAFMKKHGFTPDGKRL